MDGAAPQATQAPRPAPPHRPRCDARHEVGRAVVRARDEAMVSPSVAQEPTEAGRVRGCPIVKYRIGHLGRSIRPEVQPGYGHRWKVHDDIEGKDGCDSSPQTVPPEMDRLPRLESPRDGVSEDVH